MDTFLGEASFTTSTMLLNTLTLLKESSSMMEKCVPAKPNMQKPNNLTERENKVQAKGQKMLKMLGFFILNISLVIFLTVTVYLLLCLLEYMATGAVN